MSGIAQKRVDAGFTLLELLLAVGLLALITNSIVGGLHLGKRAWETGRNRESYSEVEAAALAISSLLERSFPAVAIGAKGSQILVFAGRPDGCLFAATNDGEAQRAGLVLMQLGVRPGPGRADLALWTKAFRAENALSTTRAKMREAEALRDVASVEMAYFGAMAPNQPPAWSSSWLDRDRLPRLVSVRIVANRSGRPVEASFVVALRQR